MSTGTFTATGQSEEISGDQYDVIIHGTFVATIEVETQAADGTWLNVSSHTSETVLLNEQSANVRKWRLNCTAYTSGTVNYSLVATRYRDTRG